MSAARLFSSIALLTAPFYGVAFGADDSVSVPQVDRVERQPLLAQVHRVAEALDQLGSSLSDEAKAIMAVPHPTGRAAMRMLEEEGFEGGDYIDIFDGGPTMSADTDEVRTIRDSREHVLSAIAEGGETRLIAAGHLKDFACCYGKVDEQGDGATLDEKAAHMLGIEPGGGFHAIER